MVVTVAILLPGCATTGGGGVSRSERKRIAAQKEQAAVEHSLYRSLANWKKTTHRNEALMAKATPENVAIEISLDEQRGILLVEGAVAMDFPVATGKKSHPTPPGHYTILSKSEKYSSNLYGKIYDVTGVVVNPDADTRTDVVPEGGWFVGSSMPYWMRLTNTGVGMHVGYVPGRPASHGCIRLKNSTAKELFALTKVGTPVTIAPQAASLAPAKPKP